MELEVVIAVIILLVLVFLASVDRAFSRLSDVSLRRLAADAEEEHQDGSASFLREIVDNRPRFRFLLSSAIQVLLICFMVLLTLIILDFTGNRAELFLLALIFGLGLTVLVRQILPGIFVRNNTERKIHFLLPVVRPLYAFSSFFVDSFVSKVNAKERQKLEASITPDATEERNDDAADDFQALMEVGEAEGIIEESERELIETMVEFSETRVAEIMTPRTEICGIPIESTILDARDLIVEEKYSRLPVYRETIDNVEGVIYVRDLVQAWSEGKEGDPIATILRDPFFVPETKTASELLKSMQQEHMQIAIVIDEYGGVAGLVTVEDILEEIVGEIEDEDIEEDIIEIVEGSDGYWDVLGSTEIDKVEHQLDIDLDVDDVTTIAGLVTSEAGYVPKPGEKLSIRGLDVEVLRADEKKIGLLRLRKSAPEEDLDKTSAPA